MTDMAAGFCKFPQSLLWPELRDHLLQLSGVRVSSFTDEPVIGSWIDFKFRGHSFTINATDGEFIFFVDDTGCPDSVLSQITSHFQPLFDGGADLSQHRI